MKTYVPYQEKSKSTKNPYCYKIGNLIIKKSEERWSIPFTCESSSHRNSLSLRAIFLALSGGTTVCCWTDETGAEMLRTILLADISHVMKRLAHSQRWREMGVSLTPTYSTAHTDDTGRREGSFFSSDFCGGDQTPHPDILIESTFRLLSVVPRTPRRFSWNTNVKRRDRKEAVSWTRRLKIQTTKQGTFHFDLPRKLASLLHTMYAPPLRLSLQQFGLNGDYQ